MKHFIYYKNKLQGGHSQHTNVLPRLGLDLMAFSVIIMTSYAHV